MSVSASYGTVSLEGVGTMTEGRRFAGRVIDGDGHVTERLELDADLVAEYFSRQNGGVPLDLEQILNDPRVPEESSGTFKTETGGYDPAVRLKDMDLEGIDIAVLYPTSPGLGFVPDALRHGRMCATYNDWLRDYCSEDTARLVGVGLVPLQDPVGAVKELDRAVNELGFRGVMIRPAPYIGALKFNDPVYDPFWDAVQAIGVPVGVHPFSFDDMPYNVVSGLRLQDDTGGNPSKGLTLRQGLGNAIDVMATMGYFVAGGICERYPRMKVVFLEGSGGWVSPMLERFDHHMKIFGSRHQTSKPSELFKRQCWISFDPDEHALAYTATSPYVGVDRIIWASDYPHPDATFPGVVDELVEAAAALNPVDQAKVIGENAAALYGLD